MNKAGRVRVVLVALAALRGVVALAAIPLAPWLYREHFVLLVLMRPTKEVLLAGGFLMRSDDVDPLVVVAAALPLLVLGVWLFYALGRSFEEEIGEERLPGLAGRLLPPKRVRRLQEVLGRRGWPVVFLGRLAAFPSTMVAAAAGSSDMPTRTFLSADGLGAVASLLEAVAAGYLLGQAYKRGGPWITAVGVAVLVVLAVVVGRRLKRA